MYSSNPTATLLVLVLGFAQVGCPGDVDAEHPIGDFVVVLRGGTFDLQRADGSVLLEGVAGATGELPGPVAWRAATPDIREAVGMYIFREDAPPWTTAAVEVEVVSEDPQRLELALGAARVVLRPLAAKTLRVSWSLEAPAGSKAPNRLLQSFACRGEDRFFGLGARVHGTEHRGEVIPAWVSEQGIGKLRRGNSFDGYPVMGDIHDTYLPVPFVLSQRGFGLLVENSRRSLFHLCPQQAPQRWAVEAWHDGLDYLVIDGPRLPDVIERLTARTGRPPLAPKWAHAPWIDAVHGPDQVKGVASKLRAAGIPASAIWTEDWIGGGIKLDGGYHLNYQWHADTTLYPDLKGLAQTLHGQGFRFLGYFNPFITKGTTEWQEAMAKGHAIRDAAGKPITFLGPLLETSTLPDLSRAETVKWLQGYLGRAEQLGFDGWMADYAEWLPLKAKLSDGSDGAAAHNLYPLQWQRANLELWDRRRPGGDYVFFVRSGWAGTGGLAPVVWAGDQQTEFAGLDGLASVIPLVVNAGMSGIPLMTHDIAGYSTHGKGVAPSTKELFFRWTELGAFSAIMRTHHGALADKNWAWDEDAETLAHFRTYARLHVALFPYRYGLAREASKRGLPVARHLALHYPDDPRAAAVKDQFMLGPHLLVAPVLKDKARSREVYLPGQGRTWFHYFTGARLPGGKQHTIAAKLEEIPVFAPEGAIIPSLVTEVDTLDRVTTTGIKDLDDAEQGPLRLRIYLARSGGAVQLYDGTQVEVKVQQLPTTAPKILVGGKAWPACASGGTEGCVEAGGGRSTTIYAGPAKDLSVSGSCGGSGCLTISVKGAPRSRRFQLVVRW